MRELCYQLELGSLYRMPTAQDGCHLAKLRRGHFFLVAAAVVLLALFRPSYFGSLAGTDRFLLFRLLMS